MVNKTTLSMKNSIWLKSAGYDLSFLILAPLFGFLWLPAFFIFEGAAPFKLAILQFLITATPHAMLTLYMLWHLDAAKKLKSSLAWPALVFSILVTLIVYLYRPHWVSNALISAVFLFGTWHILKQHIGISRLYDYVLSERTGDKTLPQQMRPVYWFYQIALLTIYLYALSNYKFSYSTEMPWTVQLIYPKIGDSVLMLFYFLTGVSFAYAGYQVFYVRHWKNKNEKSESASQLIPWPQLLVLGTSLLQPLIFVQLPQEAWFLLWLAPPLGHHIQYFGYVWLFLQRTQQETQNTAKKAPALMQFVCSKKLLPFYFVFLLCSMSVHFFSLFGLILASALALQFLTTFHYIADGVLWKKESNLLLNPMSRSLR